MQLLMHLNFSKQKLEGTAFRKGLIGEDTFMQSMSSSWGLLRKHDTLQLRRRLLEEFNDS
ncbi:MAG: hypothetical protein KDD02_15010 [Phaeodactylibacter sp.]|nr:hypothetical protein [Phaeodactylibacter sp.]MCB9302582.1 hypothetical protein [Lewinellaceae bacterium]